MPALTDAYAIKQAIRDLADILDTGLHSRHRQGPGGGTATDGLFAIANAISDLAYQVRLLGNADAATPMGAIEALGKHLGEAVSGLGISIERIGDAINEMAADGLLIIGPAEPGETPPPPPPPAI